MRQRNYAGSDGAHRKLPEPSAADTAMPTDMPTASHNSVSTKKQFWRRRSGRLQLAVRWTMQWLVLACVLVLVPRVVEGATPLFSSFWHRETCCLKPKFMNENNAPELNRCRQECRAFVQYTSTQACVLNETCVFAMANFDGAIALAKRRLRESFVCTADYRVCYPGVNCLGGTCADPPNTMSIACELALRKAMCAYHFPRCITDTILFAHEVCRETCDNVKTYCNMSLDEVVSVNKCTTRNFGCTGSASTQSPFFTSTSRLVFSAVSTHTHTHTHTHALARALKPTDA
jgi:hypothetical protein